MDTPKKPETTTDRKSTKPPVFSFSEEELRQHIEEVKARDAGLTNQEHLALLRRNALDLDSEDEPDTP